MKEPYWLTREECLALHDLMLADYGEMVGLRGENLLESALARSQQLFACGKPGIAKMAAAYTAGVVKNHPFLDGNKRRLHARRRISGAQQLRLPCYGSGSCPAHSRSRRWRDY